MAEVILTEWIGVHPDHSIATRQIARINVDGKTVPELDAVLDRYNARTTYEQLVYIATHDSAVEVLCEPQSFTRSLTRELDRRMA